MKRILFVMTSLILLAACGGPAKIEVDKEKVKHDCIKAGYEEGTEKYRYCVGDVVRVVTTTSNYDVCVGYGFKPKTDKFAECMMTLNLRDERRRSEALQGLFRDLGNVAGNLGTAPSQPFPQQTIIVPGVATCHGHVCY